MSFNLKIEGIIGHSIFTTRNNTVWDDYKNDIINNFNNLNLNNNIENYEPAGGRSLYVSRPRMRVVLYNSIVLNNNIFLEVGYNSYKPKEQYNIEHQDIYGFIEECIKLLVKKQQGK
jgi:hypothetical protein